MGRVFDIPDRKLEAMMSIVDNAQVHKRHAIFPIEYTVEPRALYQTNQEYIEHAVKLGREAAEKCLERAGVRPDEVAYPPGAEALPGVWLEARGMLRSVLETTTFADLVERSRVLAGQGDRRAPRTPAPARTRPNHR